MFYEIKTINGVKTKVPLTSQLNSTMPIGFLMANDQDVKPVNYLKCDGSTFDQNKYSGLYTYLGTNVLPTLFDHNRPGEYTQFIPVSGTVTPFTAQYDAFIQIRVESGTQRHILVNGVTTDIYSSATAITNIALEVKKGDIVTCDGSSSITSWGIGGVYFTHPLFIKALDGIDITDESAIFEQINKHNSYSTEEIATGATWIDGKPIYRKTYYSATNWSNNEIVDTVSNVDTVITLRQMASDGSSYREYYTDGTNAIGLGFFISTGQIRAFRSGSFVTTRPSFIVFEYTKTTD